MFLQLLASELSKRPSLGEDLAAAEQQFEAIQELKTLDELLMASTMRTRVFPFESHVSRIQLNNLEAAALRLKHYEGAAKELEDDFV